MQSLVLLFTWLVCSVHSHASHLTLTRTPATRCKEMPQEVIDVMTDLQPCWMSGIGSSLNLLNLKALVQLLLAFKLQAAYRLSFHSYPSCRPTCKTSSSDCGMAPRKSPLMNLADGAFTNAEFELQTALEGFFGDASHAPEALPIYVINLPDEVDRRSSIQKHLEPHDLHIVEAVNGADLDQEALLKDAVRHMSKGELGCFLSHLKTWDALAQLNCWALVLEDDARGLDGWLESVKACLREAPTDAHIIFLNGPYDVDTFPLLARQWERESIPLLPDFNIEDEPFSTHLVEAKAPRTNMHAYLLHSRGAEELRRRMEPIKSAFDVQIHFLETREGLRFMASTQQVFKQDPRFKSAVQTPDVVWRQGGK